MTYINELTNDFFALADKIDKLLKSTNISVFKKINELCKTFLMYSGHNMAIFYFISLYLLIEIYILRFSNEITFDELFHDYQNKVNEKTGWTDEKRTLYRSYLPYITNNLTREFNRTTELDNVKIYFENILKKVYDVRKK